MNCEQANTSIDLIDLLDKLGYEVQTSKSNAREAYFLSPWRLEAEGSFCVNRNSFPRKYFDHGLGEGGHSIVDFIVKHLEAHGRSNSVSDALNFLKTLGYGGGETKPLFLSDKQNPEMSKQSPNELKLIKVEDVRYSYIFDYLKSRGIPDHLASKYLLQITYRNIKQNKNYWGFGIPNQSPDSYEIRSATKNGFKTAIGNKDISIITGRREEGTINVFEGVIDFLSMLTFQNVDILNHPSLILNSLSSMNKAKSYIEANDYGTVNLFLDNDDAGHKIAHRFQNELTGEVLDFSGCYQGYKDLNEALIANIAQKAHFEFTL